MRSNGQVADRNTKGTRSGRSVPRLRRGLLAWSRAPTLV